MLEVTKSDLDENNQLSVSQDIFKAIIKNTH